MKTPMPASPSRPFSGSGLLRSSLASLAIGLTAPFVYFAAGEAVGTPGKNPPIETIFPAVIGMLYMAYCLYWLSIPTRPGFRNNWRIIIPAQLPLIFFMSLAVYENPDAGTLAATWGASTILGSLVGYRAGRWVGNRPAAQGLVPRSSRRRNLLLVGAGLLAAVSVLVAFGVIPPLLVERSYATGFRANGVAYFFGGAAGVSLLLSALLARAPWQDAAKTAQTVSFTAIGSLLLGFFWAFASGIRSQHPDLLLASRVLVACAIGSLLTAGLQTVASVRQTGIEFTSR